MRTFICATLCVAIVFLGAAMCGANPYAIEIYEGCPEEDKKATAARFWNRRSEKA